jgi:putative ABC transport system permease protein
VGLLLAFAVSRGLGRLLYNVAAVDPAVYAFGAVLMTLACVAASLLPARRAARVDPLVALRTD